jgi:putative ABC transport system permease protein
MSLLARSTSSLDELAPRLRGLIDQLDPELAISRLQPIEQAVSSSLSKPRFTAVLLGAFALLSLLLGAVGVYGITVNAVAQQSREIAIRMALGAQRREVLWRVLARTGRPVLLGASAGIAASLLFGRLVSGLLYGVAATDSLSMLAASGVLVLVAILASLGPARRATRTPLARTLRAE